MEAWRLLGAPLLLLLVVFLAASGQWQWTGAVERGDQQRRQQINGAHSRSLSGRADHSSRAEAINIQLGQPQAPDGGGGADEWARRRKRGTGGALVARARPQRRAKASQLPELAPMGNVSSVLGRDVRLVCQVEHLGQYQVAWLKEETHTILSIDTNIIITNYRIFLIPDTEERKWVLHIKDVQESDRGFYQCQVNTNPMRSTRGYLEVNVPPAIIEAQSSQLAESPEHSDLKVQCKASGHPRPAVTWHRDDGQPIRLYGRFSGPKGAAPDSLAPVPEAESPLISELTSIRSDRLSLVDVDRHMAGTYVCTASNGVPPQAIKRIPVHIKFPAKVSLESATVEAALGEQVEVDCTIEAYPAANSSWIRSAYSEPAPDEWSSTAAADWDRRQRLLRHLARLRSEVRVLGSNLSSGEPVRDIRGLFTVHRIPLGPTSYKIRMIIYKVQPADFGQYTCTASNALGDSQAHLTLARREKPQEERSQEASTGSGQPKSARINIPQRPSVFDENYLKSIQQHQQSKATSNRWRSKYPKSRARANSKPEVWMLIIIAVIVTLSRAI